MTVAVPRMTKPLALKPGARLAVVSPASTPRPERVEQGILRLQEMGYVPVLSPHALDRGPLYYAGTLEERLEDLHRAFADCTIDGIVCTRGGWGSAELLPALDAGLIRANPKVFVGYSDHTSLHLWLRREAGLVTFHGPMVAADFASEHGVDAFSWESSLSVSSAWSIGKEQGLRVLREGLAEGRLDGGCISIIEASLGTPFSAVFAEGVLFLEDIGTKPYQWDRMLLHLRYAGCLSGTRGIVFGDMRQCVKKDEQDYLEEAILHALKDFSGPIAIGLRSGHVDEENLTLPLGVQVRLDCSDVGNPRMHFLEAAISS